MGARIYRFPKSSSFLLWAVYDRPNQERPFVDRTDSHSFGMQTPTPTPILPVQLLREPLGRRRPGQPSQLLAPSAK